MSRPQRIQRQPSRLRDFDLSGWVANIEREVEEEVDEAVQEENKEVDQVEHNVEVLNFEKNVEVVANVDKMTEDQ